jgi:glycosyltransferase involved in cell wall biosynthesis
MSLQMKLSVLFILSDLETGGAQRVILRLLTHLAGNEFECHMAVIRSQGPLRREIPRDVTVHDLDAKRVRYAPLKILGLCWRLKPSVLVSTLGHLNIALLMLKPLLPRATRLVVREANTPSVRLQHTSAPLLYRLLYRKTYPLADRVVCNSEYMRRDLVERFSLKTRKIQVISNPVNLERIKEESENAGNPYEQKDGNLVAVGRLHYQKGFDLLLRAFEKAWHKDLRLRLTLVGDGLERQRLAKLAERLKVRDRVTFAGHRDNPFPYMHHADLFVSSSRWEGSPNTVLEALACGTPVLAFNCPGGTAEILREGENGWLVQEGDWERLGQKITEVIDAKQSLKTGLLPAQYRIERVTAMWEGLFAELTKSGVRER